MKVARWLTSILIIPVGVSAVVASASPASAITGWVAVYEDTSFATAGGGKLLILSAEALTIKPGVNLQNYDREISEVFGVPESRDSWNDRMSSISNATRFYLCLWKDRNYSGQLKVIAPYSRADYGSAGTNDRGFNDQLTSMFLSTNSKCQSAVKTS